MLPATPLASLRLRPTLAMRCALVTLLLCQQLAVSVSLVAPVPVPPNYTAILLGGGALPQASCVARVGGQAPPPPSASSGVTPGWLHKVGVLGDSILLPGNLGALSVAAAVADSGALFAAVGGFAQPGLSSPAGDAQSCSFSGASDAAPNGDIYIICWQFVVRFSPGGGAVQRVFGQPAASGYAGDGGRAVDAVAEWWLGGPSLSPSGILYVCDIYNHIIRAVNTATGIVTLFAGTPGVRGNVGDGGLATAAQLHYPWGNALFGDTLYIAESWNQCIRAVSITTRVISRFAGASRGYSVDANGGTFAGDGGPAALAYLNVPRDVAVDVHGNVLIAEAGSNIIRKVDGATGIISTLAGTAAQSNGGFSGDGGAAKQAQLSGPWGVRAKKDGTVLIADSGNNVIRAVNTAGIISTAAAAQTAAASAPASSGGSVNNKLPGVSTNFNFNGINGMAVFPDASAILVSSSGDGAIYKLTFATGVVSAFAGTPGMLGGAGLGGPATSARLTAPNTPIFAPDGSVYFSDGTLNAILRVSPAGILSLVAGALNVAGYSSSDEGQSPVGALLNGPSGVALDAAGNLFIADSNNNCIRVINASTGRLSTYAGACATFIDYGGLLDTHCYYIPNGTLAATAVIVRPQNIQLAADGALWFQPSRPLVLHRIDPVTRQIWMVGAPPVQSYNATTLTCVNSVQPQLAPGAAVMKSYWFASAWSTFALSPAGDVFIPDKWSQVVWTFRLGMLAVVAGTFGVAGYTETTNTSSSLLSSPNYVAYHPRAGLFISDYYGGIIKQVPFDTPTVCPLGFVCTCGSSPTPCGNGSAAYYCPANSAVSFPTSPGYVTVFQPGLGGGPVAVGQATCPVGSFCSGGSATPCYAGSFGVSARQVDAASCSACAVGSYIPTSGATGVLGGSSPCLTCPSGTYAGKPRATFCSRCPPGTAASLTGSASAGACVPCSPGAVSLFGAVACFPGQPGDGNVAVFLNSSGGGGGGAGGTMAFQRLPAVASGNLDPSESLAAIIKTAVPLVLLGLLPLALFWTLTFWLPQRHVASVMGRGLVYVDAFSLKPVPPGVPMTVEPTAGGGALTALALGVVLALMASTVVQYATSNIVTSQGELSVYISTLASARALPLQVAASAPPAAAGAHVSELAVTSGLRLTIVTMGPKCAVLVAPPASSLFASAWAYTAPAAPSSATGAQVTHTFTCDACMPGAASFMQMSFDRSCQAYAISLAAVGAGGGVSLASAYVEGGATTQPLLTGVAVAFAVDMQVIQDSVGGAARASDGLVVGGRSALGFVVKELAAAPTLTLGDANVDAGSVSLSLTIALQPLYAVTTLAPKLTQLQLFAALAAWASTFGAFAILARYHRAAVEKAAAAHSRATGTVPDTPTAAADAADAKRQSALASFRKLPLHSSRARPNADAVSTGGHATVNTADSAAAAAAAAAFEDEAANEAPLPPGWTEHWSTRENAYYWMSASGDSTWIRPDMAAPAPGLDTESGSTAEDV